VWTYGTQAIFNKQFEGAMNSAVRVISARADSNFLVISTKITLFHRRQTKRVKKVTIDNIDLPEGFPEISAKNAQLCYQCALCTGMCPWRDFKEFNPRVLMRKGQLHAFDVENDNIWYCTTCGKCMIHCPKKVEIAEVMMGFRKLALDEGEGVPATISNVLVSIFRNKNPWMARARDRGKWAGESPPVNALEQDVDVLFFVGCTASYDPRGQRIARALYKIFQAADVNFGTLGNAEVDCGCCARYLGEIDLADQVGRMNASNIAQTGASTIVTTSPHSYNIMKKYYRLPPNMEVLHYTQFLKRLIEENRLRFEPRERFGVTFHDPCYLNNHWDITEPPREVLKAIPGLELIEMPRNRESAICCGGGGGGSWQERKAKDRFSIPRLKEAVGTSAVTLATACYYCVLMFEDSLKMLGRQKEMRVQDIAEIVADALQE
jgi:Fe-S oxidoreductase